MIIYSSSFESSKPYIFELYLKNSIAAILTYVILARSNPKSYLKMEIDKESFEMTVYTLIFTSIDVNAKVLEKCFQNGPNHLREHD